MKISRTLATALFCVIAASASQAHGVQERAPEKSGFKQKLSEFQNNVKKRIDSLRGFEKADGTAATKDAPVNHFHFDHRRMNAGRQPANYQNGRSNRSLANSRVAQASYVQQDPATMARKPMANQQGNYEPRRDYRNDYVPVIAQPLPVPMQGSEPLSSTTYSLPNQGRPTNGMHTVEQIDPMMNDIGQGNVMVQQQSAPLEYVENSLRPDYQATMIQQGFQDPNAISHTDQRTGHFQNGFSHVRTLTDQHQITASERVLQLQAQVEALMAERKALIADNKRLSGIIAENRQMLGKAQSSIGASLTQLESANRNNAVLKQQIDRLIAENKSQKAESKRMLDSIQQRLNELLIREISSK